MKKRFYLFLLRRVFGWRIMRNTKNLISELPSYGDKSLDGSSVTIVAPHTSFYDGFIGKIAMDALGAKYITLSASWLFFFPLKYIMRGCLNAIPVGGAKNTITESVKALKTTDNLHIVLCPEGHLKSVDKWSKGYYYIARKANVGIDVVSLDYNRKYIIFERHINATDVQSMSVNEVNAIVRDAYFNAKRNNYAKYPEKFELDKYEI